MGLNLPEVVQLTCAVHYEWICYQTLLYTIRNKGQQTNVVCFPDECMLKGSYEEILKYMSSCEDIVDPKIVTE